MHLSTGSCSFSALRPVSAALYKLIVHIQEEVLLTSLKIIDMQRQRNYKFEEPINFVSNRSVIGLMKLLMTEASVEGLTDANCYILRNGDILLCTRARKLEKVLTNYYEVAGIWPVL